MSANIYLVSVGYYSDYTVLIAASTEKEAQAWADAYNHARESCEEEALVEELEFYRKGDPLPIRQTVWNADSTRAWQVTNIATTSTLGPHVSNFPGSPRGPIAYGYPTPEAARLAVEAAVLEAELNNGQGV